MKEIPLKSFKRLPSGGFSKLVKFVNKSIVANEDVNILIPTKYADKDLAKIADVCTIYGVLTIVNSKHEYTVLTVPTMLKSVPVDIEEVEIEGESYYKMFVPKGERVIESVDVIVLPDMAYLTFDLFLRKGKVPFYIGYTDLIDTFINLKKYAGINLIDFITVIKLIIGLTARDYDNPKIPYKLNIKSDKDLLRPVKWISMVNIHYVLTSTLAKIGGAYMKEGFTSALVNPSSKPTEFENIIRK